MENVIITDGRRVAETVAAVKAAGQDCLHVLSDFDGTLTVSMRDGRHVGSSYAAFRHSGLLGDDFARYAITLREQYHPIEVNPAINPAEKSAAMTEWWQKFYALACEFGLRREHVTAMAATLSPFLRPGAEDLMRILHSHGVPLVVMSAGVGDIIEAVFRGHHAWFGDVHIVANRFRFDESGTAVGVEEPLVHVFNKTEVTVRGLPDYASLEPRRNVVLLGDSLGDPAMVVGFEHDHLLKIGFLHDETPGQEEAFREAYDVIVVGDAGMEPAVDIIRGIVEGG